MANIGYIQVNRHCNNSCHFCSNPSTGKNISYGEGISYIDDFCEKNYYGVIFTGGEPTLSTDLPNWIKYAKGKGLHTRIISNGMMCANFQFIKKLSDVGLDLIHFSVYSHVPEVHDFLTDTNGSWRKLMLSIHNAYKLDIKTNINCVISSYNANHLDKYVKGITKIFPHIQHFIFNNMDPVMMRKTKIAQSTLPDFQIFKEPLKEAMEYLYNSGRTFRVERVPLCYMRGYEFFSTETRKIVKSEERIVHFLDFRATVKQTNFEHDKLLACEGCDLSSICGGVFEYNTFYKDVKVFPQKLTISEKKNIIQLINMND